MNLFLHWKFDVWIGREHPTATFERYADDAIVHCVSWRQAEQVLVSIVEWIGEAGLELHPEKTSIVNCGSDRAEYRKGPQVVYAPGVRLSSAERGAEGWQADDDVRPGG